MSYPPRQYWATHRTVGQVGPYKSREEAATVFFATFPSCKECLTGYGTFGPHFDMGWTQRPDPSLPDMRQVLQVTPAPSPLELARARVKLATARTNPNGWESVG